MFNDNFFLKYMAALALGLCLMLPSLSKAQCKGFAQQVVKKQLPPYIHDGNLSAMLMSEDQTITIYKDFYATQEYRMIITGSPNLPNIEFEVSDRYNNIIYTNKETDYQPTWEFLPTQSTTLSIKVRVPRHKDTESQHLYGCVTVLFGFKLINETD